MTMSGMKSKSRGDGSAMAFDDAYKNFKETSALMDRVIADIRRLLEIRYENDERTWHQFERVLLTTMFKRSTAAALTPLPAEGLSEEEQAKAIIREWMKAGRAMESLGGMTWKMMADIAARTIIDRLTKSQGRDDGTTTEDEKV